MIKMKKEEFIGKIKELFLKENRTKLIFIIGIIGILLIFLSTFFEDDTNTTQETVLTSVNVTEDTEKYKERIENELCEMLGSISGVGEVQVMVTVSGTTEFEYAQELSKDSDDNSTSYKNQYVIVEKNGEKEALIKKINKPQISGVAVVCRGGDDVKVTERIIRAVSAVLDISSNNICVVPLK